MTRVVVSPDMLARLNGLNDLLQLCDETGRVLGYFHPLPAPDEKIESPFSDEELERRAQQRTGKPLAEILRRLERS